MTRLNHSLFVAADMDPSSDGSKRSMMPGSRSMPMAVVLTFSAADISRDTGMFESSANRRLVSPP